MKQSNLKYLRIIQSNKSILNTGFGPICVVPKKIYGDYRRSSSRGARSNKLSSKQRLEKAFKEIDELDANYTFSQNP